MGVLFQDFVRYACTVDENIAFGATRPVDSTVHLPLLDFVDRLPQGRSTLLGRVFDGGRELSMGQWQRIAIARVLASDAPVVILDEPMAWMDSATRLQFLAAVERLKADRIIIMINHQ